MSEGEYPLRPRKGDRTKVTTVALSFPIAARLRQYAKDRDVKVVSVTERAIDEFLNREDQRRRDELRARLKAASGAIAR